MVANIKIRPAEPRDIPAIANLANSLALTERAKTEGDSMQRGFLVSGYRPATYAELLKKTAEPFLVAVTPDATIVGFLLAYRSDRLPEDAWVDQHIALRFPRPFIVIKQVGVHDDYASRGIGRALYQQVFANVHHDIFASVVDDPPNARSASFHEKQGFRKVAALVHPADQLERSVWHRPLPAFGGAADESEGLPSLEDGKDSLLAQFDHAIGLYKHEDSLNWRKFNAYLISLGVLATFLNAVTNDIPQDTIDVNLLVMIALAGVLVSIGFGIAMRYGVRYMQHHKETVLLLQNRVARLGGTPGFLSSRRVGKHLSKATARRSPTALVLVLVAPIGGVLWLIGCITWISRVTQ